MVPQGPSAFEAAASTGFAMPALSPVRPPEGYCASRVGLVGHPDHARQSTLVARRADVHIRKAGCHKSTLTGRREAVCLRCGIESTTGDDTLDKSIDGQAAAYREGGQSSCGTQASRCKSRWPVRLFTVFPEYESVSSTPSSHDHPASMSCCRYSDNTMSAQSRHMGCALFPSGGTSHPSLSRAHWVPSGFHRVQRA